MSAKDAFHTVVKTALEKEDWLITKTNQLCLLIYNIEQEANAYSTLRERPMAKLDEYRQYIKNLLQQHASIVWDDRIQAQTIFDT